jgi:hypothetical protein
VVSTRRGRAVELSWGGGIVDTSRVESTIDEATEAASGGLVEVGRRGPRSHRTPGTSRVKQIKQQQRPRLEPRGVLEGADATPRCQRPQGDVTMVLR